MSEDSKEAKKLNDESSEATDNAPEPRRGAKRRIIDETLLDEDEARRLETRRAYNRQCAAKARKRSKDLINSLQEQVDQLTKDKAALERTNEVMQAQLQLLEQQNRTLMMNQRGPSSMIPGVGGGSLFAGFQGVGGLMPGGGGGGGGSLPSASLLESLSAQGRLPSFRNEGNLNPNMQRSSLPVGGAGGSSSGGSGGVDPGKFPYLG